MSFDSLFLMTLILTVLKVNGVVCCSWLWVFAPLWLPVSIAAIMLFVIFVVWLVAEAGR